MCSEHHEQQRYPRASQDDTTRPSARELEDGAAIAALLRKAFLGRVDTPLRKAERERLIDELLCAAHEAEHAAGCGPCESEYPDESATESNQHRRHRRRGAAA